ncbi:MAG: hypothetical protein RLZZ370_373 [Bacteroidota bacterium]|jgi:FHS family L-fucose permease-like MFS transporter
MQQKNFKSALGIIITVFFFWGFVAASNGIFIPFCKKHFQLSQFESQLIDATFYGGYFIGSLVLLALSRVFKMEILNRLGYKRGIIYGLLISILGALAIIPSVNAGSFPLILASFFILALGFSLQQTCAQPFVIALGNPSGGAHRLSLAGGVNSLGTTLGPLAVGFILFGTVSGSGKASLDSINELYYLLAGVFLLVALFLWRAKLPEIQSDDAYEPGFGALKFPQLRLGMLAIFTYVGVEVSIQSNMGALLAEPAFGSWKEDQIAPFISLYWGSLMIGRWAGSIAVFSLSQKMKWLMSVLVPFLAFAVVLGVNKLSGKPIDDLYPYALCVGVLILNFLLSKEQPARTLLLFSFFGMAAMLIGLFSTGTISMFAFLSGGLACSIMWPSIFALSLSGLGRYSGQGSAFLIMMILGGAVIPPVQGLLADVIGIHQSYLITVLCFAYLAYFAYRAKTLSPEANEVAVSGH